MFVYEKKIFFFFASSSVYVCMYVCIFSLCFSLYYLVVNCFIIMKQRTGSGLTANRGARQYGSSKKQTENRKETRGNIKKDKTAFHKRKYSREQQSIPSSTPATRNIPVHREQKSRDVDVHLASKLAQDLKRDIALFKQRHAKDEIMRTEELHSFFSLIPLSFVSQRTPPEVKEFVSYLPKFLKGAVTLINGFLLWHEWASYEKTKGKKFHVKTKENENEVTPEENIDTTKYSDTRQALAKTYKEREHVRSLLVMCLRHNSEQRKAGQHAFVNFLNSKLVEDDVDCRSLASLKVTTHHSVPYALSRLILGMAEENLANMILNFHALYCVLTRTQIGPSVILTVMEEELALEERVKACRIRVSRDNLASFAEDAMDEVDPDDIADPTKGERNQRLGAAVFSLAAAVLSKKYVNEKDASRLAIYLCFCYVEQKATRVVSANLLFMFIQANPSVLRDQEAFQWVVYAFFSFPKLEYYRPEGVQCLLLLMKQPDVQTQLLPPVVKEYLAMDPLEPQSLEQICNALFRKEQVTAVHPMIHPVWSDIINSIVERCESGESLKAHFSTFVHTVIMPYRRGNADVPRRALFQSLITKLGQIVVQSGNASERLELLHMASKNAGYGRKTAAKPSTPEQLKQLSLEGMHAKVDDLIFQYQNIRDSDPASSTNRRWVLRELKACLSVPVKTLTTYANTAVIALLEFGFFPPFASRDRMSQCRCIYLFSDLFSFTYSGPGARAKCTLKGIDIVSSYLQAEERGKTVFTTAVKKSAFRKARNRIVEALEKISERSVLFYDYRDIEILLTLLFLVLSVDDSSNPEAKTLATDVVPDLVQFFFHGTIETIDLFFDVLMTVLLRSSLPVQVEPIFTCARRMAIGFMQKFARYIKSNRSMDILLAPLRDAYNTNNRELLRQQRAEALEDKNEDEEDENSSAPVSEGEDDEEAQSSSSSSASTSSDETMSETTSVGTATPELLSDEEHDNFNESDEDDDEVVEEEEPTQEYIEALKGMIGDVDLEHNYAPDSAYSQKRDSVRVIQLAARVGRGMQSPLVIQIYQVLLAVCRENVKVSDDAIYNASLGAIEQLLLARNRYFGSFVDSTSLFQTLGDIQSYCRKSAKALLQGSSLTPKASAAIRYRLDKLKTSALRVFHFISFLAYKNHADDGTKLILGEYYKSIFCDKGWKTTSVLASLKQDIHYYRQGFVWALLPSVFEKFADIAGVSTPQRARVFAGCCAVVEALLPRLTRLPQNLKEGAGKEICRFLQSVSLEQVYDIKHTITYVYLHSIKMVLKYNKRVHLDTAWAEKVLKTAVENDEIKMTGATIRVLVSIEKILGLTPKARETKTPVPMKSLYQQFDTHARDTGFRTAKQVRHKTLKRFLSLRNGEKDDGERSAKRRRKEELKVEDRLQRQVLRESSRKLLSKEEREEKRKRIMMAKQERIAKNKERKRRLHELRQKSFERWRREKIAQRLSQE